MLAKKKGVKNLIVKGDLELVVKQIREKAVAKNVRMRSYRHRIWDLIDDFEAFNIEVVPRTQNSEVDRMA